ncbi:BlaI/MecI/CopY family transcriptional regulator [Paenibacillus yanchengensis]|uniref:BlaI/MecI/CopY family transcriptional regulator n=1 Tax=Paenibacillus yanchengensis TaxID=2035833 RepID=A0ABW4YI79_9BACL
MENYKLFDAEYKFACLVWDNEPINSTELVKLSQAKLGWKKSTTYTVLRKLCERGILQNEDAMVTSIVKKAEALKYESQTIVERNFNGSLPQFLTAFLNEKKLSEKEATELKRIIEEATR